MIRLFEIPERMSETLTTANTAVLEMKRSISSVLLPLTLLLWLCLIVVGCEISRGDSSLTGATFVHRTVTGAIDQLWYVIFYFSLPFTWHACTTNIERIRDNAGWIVVDDDYIVEDDWLIIQKPHASKTSKFYGNVIWRTLASSRSKDSSKNKKNR